MNLINKSEISKKLIKELPVWDFTNIEEVASLFSVNDNSEHWNIITTNAGLFKVPNVKGRLQRKDANNLVDTKERNNLTIKQFRHSYCYNVIINGVVVYSNKKTLVS